MKIIAVIPARYSSTRLAGKVLLKDTGKFLIQHTYEQASKAKLPDRVIIAADDEKIVSAAKSFGAECILTSVNHQSGTDRIAEVVQKLTTNDYSPALSKVEGLTTDFIIVNVQGDEPEIDPANIDKVAKLLVDNPNYPMATLVAPFEKAEDVKNPNIVKVILADSVQRIADSHKLKTQNSELRTQNLPKRAIYFSRSPIPYDRQSGGIGDLSLYLRHIGIYAYRKDFLLKITTLPQSPLEKTEKLEQLRAIENGYGILAGKIGHTCDGIDTPEQYTEFVKRYKNI